MIPDFNDDGYLPAGIHGAKLDEIEQRFAHQSELRRVQMESVRWLLDVAFRAGIRRVVVNGSFVTDIVEPNDVDCVLLGDRDFPEDETLAELLAGFPFLDIEIVNEKGFDEFVNSVFATDRMCETEGHDRGIEMSIQSDQELEVTRAKLHDLEMRYQDILSNPDNTYIEQLTLRSLRRMMNQMKEEIARFTTRVQQS